MTDALAVQRIRNMSIPSGPSMGVTVGELEQSTDEPWNVLGKLRGDNNKVFRDYAKILKAQSLWADGFMETQPAQKPPMKPESSPSGKGTGYAMIPANSAMQLYPKKKMPESNLTTAAQAAVAAPVVQVVT